MNPEAPVTRAGLQIAAEQRGTFAHPDQAMPPAGGDPGASVLAQSIDHSEIERVAGERNLDLRSAISVTGRVRQRLLEDPVRAPVDARREWTGVPPDRCRQVEPGGAMSLRESLERCKPGRWLDVIAIGRWRRVVA
jgi:hypothetical protein